MNSCCAGSVARVRLFVLLRGIARGAGAAGRAPDHGGSAEALARRVAALRRAAAGDRRQGQDVRQGLDLRASRLARQQQVDHPVHGAGRGQGRGPARPQSSRSRRRISGCGRRRSIASGASPRRIAGRGSSGPTSASRISRSATSITTTTCCRARTRSTASACWKIEVDADGRASDRSTPRSTLLDPEEQLHLRADRQLLGRHADPAHHVPSMAERPGHLDREERSRCRTSRGTAARCSSSNRSTTTCRCVTTSSRSQALRRG